MPLVVLAMMQEGFPFTLRAWAKACSMASKSWPSIHCTSKPKRLKFLVKRTQAGNFFDLAVDLQAVVIDNRAEIVEVVVACKHCSFPHLAFFQLTISPAWCRRGTPCGPSCLPMQCRRRRKRLGQGSRSSCRCRELISCRDAPAAAPPMCRKFSSSSRGKKPRSAKVAYNAGQPCPLLRTNRSRSGICGFLGSICIS